jgi:hypothetical protein
MTDHVTAYVPLFRFSCEIVAFAIAPGVRLQRSSTLPDLDLKALSDREKNELPGVGYWLVIDDHAADGHSAAERMNQWAFALWLVRPTHLELRFRFEESVDGSYHGFSRLHSSTRWNQEDVDPGRFTAIELAEAQQTFAVFETIPTDSRLEMALSLSVEATWQHRWHAGIVLHSAAAETLLTSERGRGLTSRLANAYAALISPGASDRNAAITGFAAAYDARSGIVHGRSELDEEGARLRALALWSDIIRDIWRVIIAEPAALFALQGNDSIRNDFLDGR